MIKTEKLSEETIIKQSKGNIVSDMNGEKVMLSVEKGKYYNLGSVGGDIWALAKKSISIDKLILELVDDYAIAYNECRNQVLPFLEHLLKEGLIEISKD